MSAKQRLPKHEGRFLRPAPGPSLRLVQRKNLVFTKRNRKDVLLEVLFPCLFFLLLGVLKSNVGAVLKYMLETKCALHPTNQAPRRFLRFEKLPGRLGEPLKYEKVLQMSDQILK